MKTVQVIPGRYYIDETGRMIGPMVEGVPWSTLPEIA